jgi:colicin import membrane protein
VRETRADTRTAVISALLLHALLFGLMFAGMWWTRSLAPLSAAGPAIEADLVDPNALAAPLRRALDAPAEREPEPAPQQPAPPQPQETTPPPQPEPEPRPEDSQVQPQPQAQERIPVPDTREQERVEREAEAARKAEREQEAKRRQEQLDLTERKRQEEAEKKQRLAQQQQQQKDIAQKLEKIRAEREKAKKAADLAEQKLRQIADAKARNATATATASPPPGNNGADEALGARYAAALTEAILRNWTRPDTVPLGQRCVILIRQVPGGTVIEAKVDPSCPYDELGRRSIEAAVLKAQPLPYAGFEPVFNRNLRLNFQAADR